MNVLLGIDILIALAVLALLIDPTAQRHLSSWLRAHADRQESMRQARRNARAFEELQRRRYFREMTHAE